MLGIPRSAPPPARPAWPYGLALAGSWIVYSLLDHGNASHEAPGQIAGLALLLVWIPLTHGFARRYVWPGGSAPWLRAASAWWAVLVISGWITFLPGPSELLKFSHGLVAHAHLAMACWLTAVLQVLLCTLSPTGGAGEPAGGRAAFLLWQGGSVLHLAALAHLAARESADPAALFLGDPGITALLALRLIAGLAMLAASVLWLRSSWIPHELPS
jgi:cytochrome c oxidase cbb3-type subunit I